jgi:hypothetical protein
MFSRGNHIAGPAQVGIWRGVIAELLTTHGECDNNGAGFGER